MKHKIIFLIVCVSALVFCSCEHKEKYHSGRYFYQYYLVNGTASSITLDWVGKQPLYQMNAGDSVCIMNVGNAYTGDDLTFIHRPTLEDGYEGRVDAGNYVLTYQNHKYSIDDKQTNSFTYCANYKGNVSPISVFIYTYIFVIDEAYIATLPLIE